MNFKNDIFIHFTTRENAKDILADGRLSNTAIGSGGSGAYAVSVEYGHYNHEVIKHVNDYGDDVVAVVFTTDTKPKVTFCEETVWEHGANITEGFIVDSEDAKDALGNSHAFNDGDDEWVEYTGEGAEIKSF